ncbi:DnaJ-domain-containing protein [Dichotomocladium elegans]|nr:DnaJ-domain-containing protein [Dichotomocladium elegans]
MTNLPDYYSILEVATSASQSEIREAYKKQALLHHPDRLGDNVSTHEREEATRRFQAIADAYYILGDADRRATYDRARRQSGYASARDEVPRSDANRVFSDVFEELLRPEVEHPGHLWRIMGASAGIILGFIVGNIGGAVLGGVAGRSLGKIRDNKGVSVYTAFQRLSINERRDILTALLARFLTQGASGMMK